MIIIKNSHTDPYFNLAAEEYLIDNIPGNLFMLWINEASVIIGRNQNAFAELDTDYIAAHSIKVVRRLTGGGAVFHDPGNVNYTFVTGDGSSSLDFRRFCTPIIEALLPLGINAELSGRNDITVGGMKISGTAQTLRNGRVLHHGTLLFDADLGKLAGALRPDPAKLQSKGIKSVSSRVSNLRPLINADLDTVRFLQYIENYVTSHSDVTAVHELDAADTAAIERLRDEKYSTWDWNMGQSKLYSSAKKQRFAYGSVECSVTADHGQISELHISGDFFGTHDIAGLESALTGVRYDFDSVAKALGSAGLGKYIAGASAEDIARLIV